MTLTTGPPNVARHQAFSVIIINYNTCGELYACLGSLVPEGPSHVVVVDNDSSDDSVEMVRSAYPWVELLVNERNVGYGAASNRAMAGCDTPYALLLNSDTRLESGALEALGGYLDQHPRAAIVGPRLVNPDGTLQATCYPFPRPFDTLVENSTYAVLLGRWIRRSVPGIRRLYWRTWPHDSARQVPWIKGAALAIRLDAFRAVGGFDESFFMYFEDADLCYRMKKAGWEVHFAPVATVAHVGGASTDKVRGDMAIQLVHSTHLFYRRHKSRWSVSIVNVMMKGLMLVRWVSGMLRLSFTSDAGKRSEIEKDMAVSYKILIGQERK